MKILPKILSRIWDSGFRIKTNLISAANDETVEAELSIANALGGEATFDIKQKDSLFIPFGKYQHAQGLQLFDKASAEILQAACNDLGPFPIYKGHPDVPGRPDTNPSAPAVGWAQGIQIENDGVRIPVKWNGEGERATTEAEYRFYSPFWDLRKVQGGIQPVRIRSIGLTNNPRIPVPPIANDDTQTGDIPKKVIKMLIAGKLLKEEDAADPEKVKAAINAAGTHINNAQMLDHHKQMSAYHEQAAAEYKNKLAAANDQLAELTTERDNLKAQLEVKTGELKIANDLAATLKGEVAAANDRVTAARASLVDNEIGRLVEGGKITAADKDATRTELLAIANDVDLTAKLTALHAAKPVIKTTAVTGDGLGTAKSEAMQAAANDTAVRSQARRELVDSELKKLPESMPSLQRFNEATDRARRAKPELFQ